MYGQRLDERQVTCPYCASAFTLLVDASQGSHETIEDCHWCCRPIVVTVVVSELGGELEAVHLRRDDETGPGIP